MEQREITEQIRKLHSEDAGKFIKIRDIFEDVVGEGELSSAQALSDQQFERLRSRFKDADVPFIWCNTKEAVYQLQKAIYNCRAKSGSRYDDYPVGKKSAKTKKKGLFGLFR